MEHRDSKLIILVLSGGGTLYGEMYEKFNGSIYTDAIGRNNSIKGLAKSGNSKAYDLIRNRYYVLLTRDIPGQRLFFEDKLTENHVKGIINGINK